ncbi:MAG: PDZ domain-containing protein, partial [Verrucomicrobia bacterium]|nr:PDZ domain-containing protein [Verrucomicrobiota bacterium]
AEKAGLKATTQSSSGRILLGDLIKEIDNKKVNDSSDLFRILDAKSVGDKVTVTIEREGKEKKMNVSLGALKN